MTTLYQQTLAPDTSLLLQKLTDKKFLHDFYLAGGTALALQLGHRQSVDLDWFRSENIKTKELIKTLSRRGFFELVNEEENTVEGILDKVKVSFMTYPYTLLKKKIKYNKGVELADQLDIAIMKLGAIAGRNSKKDFIDLYFFLQANNVNLTWLFKNVNKKFKGVKYDPYHIYKSLVYFDEADVDPDPKMMLNFNWEKIKKFFKTEVKKQIA